MCGWSTEHLEEVRVCSALTGVFAGLMSAYARIHRKRASRSRFVRDVASWLLRQVVCQSGQGSREVPGPSVPGRVCSRSIAPDVFFGVFKLGRGMRCRLLGSEEDEVSLARRESRADFPEVSLQLLDPSKWRLAAYGGFSFARKTS